MNNFCTVNISGHAVNPLFGFPSLYFGPRPIIRSLPSQRNRKNVISFRTSLRAGNRSAPKGRQQMGETGFCKNLRFSAVSCENLRFPAVFCANLRLPNPLIYRASRKSAKICKNLRKCAFWVRFLPFAVSLLARPEGKEGKEHSTKANQLRRLRQSTDKRFLCSRRFREGTSGVAPIYWIL